MALEAMTFLLKSKLVDISHITEKHLRVRTIVLEQYIVSDIKLHFIKVLLKIHSFLPVNVKWLQSLQHAFVLEALYAIIKHLRYTFETWESQLHNLSSIHAVLVLVSFIVIRPKYMQVHETFSANFTNLQLKQNVCFRSIISYLVSNGYMGYLALSMARTSYQ